MTWTAAEAAEIQALKDEVKKLRRDVGNMDVKYTAPPPETPSGQYPLAYRVGKELGPSTDSAVAKVDSFELRLRALEMESASSSSPSGGLVKAETTPERRDPGYLMRDPATGFTCMVFITPGDFGMRQNYNYKEPYDPDGNSFSRKDLPQALSGFEQDGAFFIHELKPANIGAGPWDNRPGKAFKIYPLGIASPGGLAGEFVSIVSPQPGRGIELAMSEPGGDGSSYTAKFRISGDGSANPIYLFVNGRLRQVMIDANGFLRA